MQKKTHFIRIAGDGWGFEEVGTGVRFVPLGCNYYDAHTGWPPQMWKKFNPEKIRDDFRKMEDLGMNAIRVWVQWKTFMPQKGRLSSKALDRCRLILSYAETSGIRVNLTGPEFWEGVPPWLAQLDRSGYQHLANPAYHDAHAMFWEKMAFSVRDEESVYGFDLVNEPFMPWDGNDLRQQWNTWLRNRYRNVSAIRSSWGGAFAAGASRGAIPPPPNRRVPGSQYLVDYQIFREELAAAWIAQSVEAIRSVNPNPLITVGLHQSSSPFEEVVPSRYTAFNPYLLRKDLDYISLHWYPFGNPFTASCLPFDLRDNLDRSLSVLLANCRYCFVGKPVVMEEFSYYGGGSPQFWGGVLPDRSEEEQSKFSTKFLRTTKGSLGGWLNWPLQDTPGSTDTSAYGGFYTSAGRLKAWGEAFRNMSADIRRRHVKRTPPARLIPISRASLLTDAEACNVVLNQCHRLYKKGILWDFEIHN